MKIVFTTSGDTLDATVDSRFGRAPKFLVYDLDKGSYEIVDNCQNLNAAQGAGIQSAEKVTKLGANYLVTGHCGPKAFRVLAAAGIKVYTTKAATITDALHEFQIGTITEASAADVEGHW